MSRCIKCHVVEKTALIPPIPFDDTMALRAWLNEKNHRHSTILKIQRGEMPPQEYPLTESQKASLLEVIQLLK